MICCSADSHWLVVSCHNHQQAIVVTTGDLTKKNGKSTVFFLCVSVFFSFQVKLDGVPLSSSEISVGFSVNIQSSPTVFSNML